ncbi:MAG: substrate-binding domain-containing protein [Gemmatimonadaceae bacterium]
MRATLIFALLTAVTNAPLHRLPAQNEVVVIVNNASISTESLTRDEVSKMFLKKVPRWENGTTVAPVDLASGSPTRDVFSQAFFYKSTAAIKAYWQNQIFAGRQVPPPERDSEQQVVDFVRTTPGAIGYVSAALALAPGVRPVRILRR